MDLWNIINDDDDDDDEYLKMSMCCWVPSRRFWEECAVAEDAHTSGTSQRRMSQCCLCLRVVRWGFKRDDVPYRAGRWLNDFTEL